MQPPSWKIHGALFTAALIYGASYSITRYVMPSHIQPQAFIVLRIAGALLLMLIYNLLWVKQLIRSLRDYGLLALCAFFGVGLNMVMFFEGLARTSPVHASLIMVITPVLVLLLGFLLKTERPGLLRILGIGLGALGASLLIISGTASDKVATLKGDIFILINAASYAVYLVMVKTLTRRYDALTISMWTFIFGLLMVTPFGFKGLTEARWGDMNAWHWATVVFTVLCTTFMTYTLNAYAIKYVKSSVVGAYVYLQPLLGIFIAVAFAGYPLQGKQLVYGLIIFAGVYLAGKKGKAAEESPIETGTGN